MTTQASQGGKGKKKNKETKISLDEFNQYDAPHGHSVVSLKMTGLDWAEAMADHDSNRTETAQIVVPSKPRAQRGPAVDIDTLPTEPPFRVSVFNLPLSGLEEDELTKKHFKDINVIKVESTKTSTTVELASRDDLYEALSRDGMSIRNRTINVCLYGHQPPNSYDKERYGGRGGGGGAYSDRYNDRNQGGFNRSRTDDRYADRAGGSSGFSRDRTSYAGGPDRGGFTSRGGGYNQQRGGYGADRYDRGNFRENVKGGSYTSGGGEPSSEESNDWRARPNIVRQPPPAPVTAFNDVAASRPAYVPPRHEPSQQQLHQSHQPHHYQPPSSHHNLNQNHDSYNQPRQQHHHHSYNQQQHHHNQSSNHPNYQDYPNQGHARPVAPVTSTEERPKLVLQKRKTPLNIDDVSSAARNEAIFGSAKPSSKPYEKMKEIEEKLKAVQVSNKTDAVESSASVSPTAGPKSNQQAVPPRSKNVSESSQHENSSRPVQS